MLLSYVKCLTSKWQNGLTAFVGLVSVIHICGSHLFQSDMQDKQKVTLYLSDTLHRQFKIRSAVEGETMSAMAQRAIEFYLDNAELVECSDGVHGQAHQVHSCPQCDAAVALKGNELALVGAHGNQVLDDELVELRRISRLATACEKAESKGCGSGGEPKSPDEGELITC